MISDSTEDEKDNHDEQNEAKPAMHASTNAKSSGSERAAQQED